MNSELNELDPVVITRVRRDVLRSPLLSNPLLCARLMEENQIHTMIGLINLLTKWCLKERYNYEM